MKKAVSVMLAVFLFFSMLPTAVNAYDAELPATGEDTVIAYGIDNTYTKWSVIKGDDGNILQFEPATAYTPVPVFTHGYDIHTGVAEGAWMNYMKNVSQIILLPGVNTVQTSAFRCERRTSKEYKYYGSIRLEAYSLDTINEGAFYDLGLGEVVLHSRVTYIGKDAFNRNPIQNVYVDHYPDYFASNLIDVEANNTALTSAIIHYCISGEIAINNAALACGDVLKNDGKITTADAARINAAAQKIDPLW